MAGDDIPSDDERHQDGYSEYKDILAEWKLLPNLISVFRAVLIVPIVALYHATNDSVQWTVVGLVVVSYISDYFDGFFARRFHQQSRLGLILDPLADKLWTISMTCLLTVYEGLPAWIAVLIVLRDLSIMGTQLHLLRKRKIILRSDEVGRKYMVVVGIMTFGYILNVPGAIWLAYGLVAFAFISVGRYCVRYVKKLREGTFAG